jgi:hypothetical protein
MASASTRRAQQAMRQLHRIGIGGVGRNDAAGAGNFKLGQQPFVVEEASRQTRAPAKRVLLHQFLAGISGSEVERILVSHLTAQAELLHQGFQSVHRLKTGPVGPPGAFEAIGCRQFGERPIDLPQQHRGARGGAASAGELAVHDHDIEPLAGKPLRHQRAGNAASDNQHVAAQIARDGRPKDMFEAGKPWRTATAQIGLFGVF